MNRRRQPGVKYDQSLMTVRDTRTDKSSKSIDLRREQGVSSASDTSSVILKEVRIENFVLRIFCINLLQVEQFATECFRSIFVIYKNDKAIKLFLNIFCFNQFIKAIDI